MRPPFPVWRKRYINLNLWGPCLKWSLKSRSPQHDSGWQQSERICGSLSKYIGLSSYRIYAIHGKVSHQGHHTNGLCYQLQICCDWMLFTPSQGFLFLPKFHCELNIIELIWGRSKWFVRWTGHPDEGTLKALVWGKDGNPKGLIWASFEMSWLD